MKKLLILLLCLALAMSMLLTSCNKDEDGGNDEGSGAQGGSGNEGGNEGDNEGGNTENGGGNEGGEDENKPTACEHEGIIICEKCFAALYSADLPAFDFGDELALAVKVTDAEIKMTSYEPENAGILTANIAEAYVGLDDDGKLVGYGVAKLYMSYSKYDRTDDIDAYVFIEGNTIYLSTEGIAIHEDARPIDSVYSIDLSRVPELEEAYNMLVGLRPTIEGYTVMIYELITENLLPLF